MIRSELNLIITVFRKENPSIGVKNTLIAPDSCRISASSEPLVHLQYIRKYIFVFAMGNYGLTRNFKLSFCD